ncbi:hypothetical protein CF326_g5159 [Tilletia indica]|nr:hypothetical protein CF326_g5159 [Tilletia indica]
MQQEELEELLRNTPPSPVRGPQHRGTRYDAAAPYRGSPANFAQMEPDSWSASAVDVSDTPLVQDRSPSKLTTRRSQGLRGLRTVASLVMSKTSSIGVLRSKLPTTPTSPTFESGQHASSSSTSNWANAQYETDLRISRDSLRLAQAFADLSATIGLPQTPPATMHHTSPQSTPNSGGAYSPPSSERPLPAPHEQQEQDYWSNTQEATVSASVDSSQALQISTTDAVDSEATEPSSLPSFYPDSLAGNTSTAEITQLPTTPPSVPSSPPKSRFREHPELLEPWQYSTPPSSPPARFRYGDNFSQPSIASIGDMFESGELERPPEPSSFPPRLPFRLLRSGRGHSISTSSLLTSVTSPSPLRSTRASPEQKKRSNLMRGMDLPRWAGGMFSSGHTMDSTSPLKISTMRKRRASLGSLGQMLSFGRGRCTEESSIPGHLQTARSMSFMRSNDTEGSSAHFPAIAGGKRSFKVWPFQQHDDPFASQKPMTILPRRNAQARETMPQQDDPNDADLSSSSPGSEPFRRPHFKALPRLSISTTGFNLRGSRGPDDPLPQNEFQGNPFRYSWMPHFGRSSFSQASSTEPTRPLGLPEDDTAQENQWPTAVEDMAPTVSQGPEYSDEQAGSCFQDVEAQPQTLSQGSGLKRGKAIIRSVGELVSKPGLWLSNSLVNTEPEGPAPLSQEQASIRTQFSMPSREGSEVVINEVPESATVPETPAPSLRRMKGFYIRSVRSLASITQMNGIAGVGEEYQGPPPSSSARSNTSGIQRSVLRGSRTSRRSSISHLTSPDSEMVANALGLSFASLPTAMPSGEYEQSVEGDIDDPHGWNLLQTASPLCSPRHQLRRPSRTKTGRQQHRHSSEEVETSSGSRFGQKWTRISGESFATAASGLCNSLPRVSVFNVATSSSYHADQSAPVPDPPRSSSIDLDYYRIDLDIASPTLDLIDEIDQIIAASSDFPLPPARATSSPHSQWLPRTWTAELTANKAAEGDVSSGGASQVEDTASGEHPELSTDVAPAEMEPDGSSPLEGHGSSTSGPSTTMADAGHSPVQEGVISDGAPETETLFPRPQLSFRQPELQPRTTSLPPVVFGPLPPLPTSDSSQLPPISQN